VLLSIVLGIPSTKSFRSALCTFEKGFVLPGQEWREEESYESMLPTTVEKRNTTGIHTDAKYEHVHEWNKGKALDEMATIPWNLNTKKLKRLNDRKETERCKADRY